MKAAAYFWVSTEDQRERQTIETQVGEVRRHCEQHGIALYDTYADDGVSGTIPFDQRPAGARLLQDARAGHFSTEHYPELRRRRPDWTAVDDDPLRGRRL